MPVFDRASIDQLFELGRSEFFVKDELPADLPLDATAARRPGRDNDRLLSVGRARCTLNIAVDATTTRPSTALGISARLSFSSALTR
jgi:hypothetical protein